MYCWEFMKCGREANGRKIDELGSALLTLPTDNAALMWLEHFATLYRHYVL